MKAMELARTLQLQTHAEQIMEYTGNDFNSTISTIAKENEIKQRLGLVAQWQRRSLAPPQRQNPSIPSMTTTKTTLHRPLPLNAPPRST
jgi:hypothetical protein